MDIKIGDKVQRIDSEYHNMKKGDIGTIAGFSPGGSYYIKEFGGKNAGGHDPRMFKPYKEEENTLSNVIEKAINEIKEGK